MTQEWRLMDVWLRPNSPLCCFFHFSLPLPQFPRCFASGVLLSCYTAEANAVAVCSLGPKPGQLPLITGGPKPCGPSFSDRDQESWSGPSHPTAPSRSHAAPPPGWAEPDFLPILSDSLCFESSLEGFKLLFYELGLGSNWGLLLMEVGSKSRNSRCAHRRQPGGSDGSLVRALRSDWSTGGFCGQEPGADW